MRALIVGGGIGGLAAALALARHGARATLLEQADAFGEVGAGIQLGPNATRRLAELGVARGLDAVAAQPEALSVRSARDGHELARLPLGAAVAQRYGAPYLCLHRADLHGLLLDAVRQGEVAARIALHTGVAVQTLHDRPHGGPVVVSDARGQSWEAEALVGADGLWSPVRTALQRREAPPRPTGHTAWRALLPLTGLPAAVGVEPLRTRVQVWLGPRLHAVAYPVRRGEWLNVVVLGESAPPGDARDWDQRASLDSLRQATGQVEAGLQRLLEAVPAWRAWSLHDREPISGPSQMAWGRVALLGDAAHPMLPYLAQGAGMAIEDAAALGPLLAGAGWAEVPAALARYAEQRWARNAQVQARARRNGVVFHATGPLRWARDAALRLAGARLLDQPWLYAR